MFNEKTYLKESKDFFLSRYDGIVDNQLLPPLAEVLDETINYFCSKYSHIDLSNGEPFSKKNTLYRYLKNSFEKNNLEVIKKELTEKQVFL